MAMGLQGYDIITVSEISFVTAYGHVSPKIEQSALAVNAERCSVQPMLIVV